jgi:UDP-glucose 4-epimerase
MITILGEKGFFGSSLKKGLYSQGIESCGLSRPSFDLTKPSTYESIPEKTKILIHAAGAIKADPSSQTYWHECVQSTHDLTEFLNNERKLDLFMYASSGAVYKPSNIALNEESTLKPDSLYGMSRLLAETIISTKANFNTVIIRLFFPFGPGQDPPRDRSGYTNCRESYNVCGQLGWL